MQKEPLFYFESLVGALISGLVITIRAENNRTWSLRFRVSGESSANPLRLTACGAGDIVVGVG